MVSQERRRDLATDRFRNPDGRRSAVDVQRSRRPVLVLDPSPRGAARGRSRVEHGGTALDARGDLRRRAADRARVPRPIDHDETCCRRLCADPRRRWRRLLADRRRECPRRSLRARRVRNGRTLGRRRNGQGLRRGQVARPPIQPPTAVESRVRGTGAERRIGLEFGIRTFGRIGTTTRQRVRGGASHTRADRPGTEESNPEGGAR